MEGIMTTSYPETINRGIPNSPHIDLSNEEERRRLSASAIRAFFNIRDKWGDITIEEARALLGGISHGSYYNYKGAPDGVELSQDSLTRISYLVGIYKALNILYGNKLANQWITMPNTNPLFKGTRPLDFIIKGGLPALQTVRRLLDARRGGF